MCWYTGEFAFLQSADRFVFAVLANFSHFIPFRPTLYPSPLLRSLGDLPWRLCETSHESHILFSGFLCCITGKGSILVHRSQRVTSASEGDSMSPACSFVAVPC